MTDKRTTQKLSPHKVGKDTFMVLTIKDLKKNTILSRDSEKADWIYITPLGFSVAVIALKKGNYFEVKALDEKDHVQMAILNMTNESKEVQKAEAFVTEWLKSQRMN
jgi:hypothetical protein